VFSCHCGCIDLQQLTKTVK